VFFDSWGRILSRSAEVLRNDIRPAIDDEFLIQQLDAVAVIVSEVGAAWADLFSALERENALLEQTLGESQSLSEQPVADPLRRNRELLTALDEVMWTLHDRGDERALRTARKGLQAAAEVERELLAAARERGGMATTRRL
jgi:hypothetical protein